MKTYSELIKLKTFEERFNYLKLDGRVGEETFGFDRYINQQFYSSKQWKDLRKYIIARDKGCDLAIDGRDIYDKVLIHHMNPININDIINRTDILLNPEYLITISNKTHNAIHYGIEDLIEEQVERFENDTCPWKK